MIGGTSSVRRYIVQGRSPESRIPFPTALKNLLVAWAAFPPTPSLSVLEAVTSVGRVLPAATASPVVDVVVVSGGDSGTMDPFSDFALSSAAAHFARGRDFGGGREGGRESLNPMDGDQDIKISDPTYSAG